MPIFLNFSGNIKSANMIPTKAIKRIRPEKVFENINTKRFTIDKMKPVVRPLSNYKAP
jgi:hypothetical protein